MAIPTTRTQFKDYCLRSLGFGVIDINVSDAQVEDRIDEALQYFAQYHYDGVERMYLKYKVTSEDITRATSNETTTAADTKDGTDDSSSNAGDFIVLNTSADDGDRLLFEDGTSDPIAVLASHGITLSGQGWNAFRFENP